MYNFLKNSQIKEYLHIIFVTAAKSPLLFYKIPLSLMYSNSYVNPIVCAFQSSNYRSGFKRVLCGWNSKQNWHSFGAKRWYQHNCQANFQGHVENIENVLQGGCVLQHY